MVDYNLTKLNNGLKLFTIKRSGFKSVDLTLYVKAGSVYENKNNNGISHLLEHFLFYNRKKPKLYPFGLDINAFTRKDFTYYEASVSKKYIQEILQAFQEIIFKPKFNSNNLQTIKNIAKEEINDRKDDPFEALNNQIDTQLYPETSISLPVLGTKTNVDKLTSDDLKNWYQTFYVPENMVFTVVGDISANQAKKWVEEYFDFKQTSTKKQNLNTEDLKLQTKNKEFTSEDQKFDRGYLALVYPANRNFDLSFVKYNFLWHLINQKLRPIIESSDLFYDMEFLYFYDLFRGEYQATVSFEKSNLEKIKKMIVKTIEEMSLSKSFFQKTKDYFINNFIAKQDSLDELSSLAIYLLNPANKMIKQEDEIKQIKKITLTEIRRMKNDIFKKDNRYSFVLK